jgi:hypothetical protein
MKKTILLATVLGLAFGVSTARADEAADCDAGIALIKAEQAKSPPKKVADTLKTSLRVAEREKGEKEYDECLDAVADAKKAVGAKN